MHNGNKPTPDDLPTSAQLLKSTAIAAASAVAILTLVVLPAEYNIDPVRKRLNVSLTWRNKTATRLQEAMTVFARPAPRAGHRWEMDVLGEYVSPANVTAGGEQYIHALVQAKPDGSMQEARMDVVARSAVSGTTLIDFRLSIPPRTGSEGLLRHEELKYARYPVHVDGARITNAIFLPGVVSALGGVGPHLREYLANLEAEGRTNGRRSFASMSLVDFMSCHAVYLCAERVRNAFAADARRVGAAGTEGQA